jgi:TATA-binding protein-associated factor
VGFLGGIDFLYAVLDEGHIIRNPKTKTTQAAKKINAEHRVILSGTPLQNNVVELWSLFDFLTPGYLGTQREFSSAFARPILASKDPKAKAPVRERGILALEGLHRQILPFIMRRTKESVLADLPKRIIQDYLCDLSPLQLHLYDDFFNTVGKDEDEGEDEGVGEVAADPKKPVHQFQKLQLLRKLCNHPSIALESAKNAEQKVKAERWLQKQSKEMHVAEHSGKLLALESLLKECGIGVTANETEAAPSSLHRVLLFCQQAATMDLIESLLLKPRMPQVCYCRLDGDLELGKRFAMVNQFNNDPTIDLMLLTVKVGGLGLNLTGADTVIFFENDWNPQVDRQAMDRAHRLGQKRVVNVYRLITKNTLEESIMNLQQFKMKIAEMVVNEENASMSTMEAGALLDLVEDAAVKVAKDKKEEVDQDEEQLNQYKEMMKFV